MFVTLYCCCRTVRYVGQLSVNLYHIQSTPLNRVTLVSENFDQIKRSELIQFLWFCSWPSDQIKRNLGVGRIKQNELILFLWFCSWPSDQIKRNLGVGRIKQNELILFLWFCSWPSDPIKRSRLYIIQKT